MENLYFVSSFNTYIKGKLFNNITQKHIFCDKENREFLDLCLGQQLEKIEEDNFNIILQLAAAELLYRGIIIPIEHIDNEEEYLESISLFIPGSNNIFNTSSITEDFLLNINKPSIVFCDIACDVGGTRPGTRFGPNLLRSRAAGIANRSNKLSILDLKENKKITGEKKIYDLGSVNIDSLTCKKSILKKVEKAADQIPQICIPIFLGGDHLMSYPLIKSLHKKHPNMELIQLDHHLDIQIWGEFEKNNPRNLSSPVHSNFISWLKKDIPDLEITQIGINSYQGVAEDTIENSMEYINNLCSRRITNLDILLSDDYLKKLPHSKEIYLTIDVDVVSSIFMPVTGYPAPLGINPDQFLKIIDYITKNNKIIGIDFMEFGVSNKFDIHLSSADIICSAILMILGNLI